MSFENDYNRWMNNPDLSCELRDELKKATDLNDRFYRELEFGTGGLRGIIGAGSNRMNIYTVRKATQGLANYINGTCLNKSVAIAYDTRIKSDEFAKQAAMVLAANNIKVYIYQRTEPTPALSYAVKYYNCGAGICITASHNPAEYNGYKVYGSDGCQITLKTASEISKQIKNVDIFEDIKIINYNTALNNKKIIFIPDSCINDYINDVYKCRVNSDLDVKDLSVVYTPLNGSGLECVQKILNKLGIKNLNIVKSQENPDGNFPTCPYPNPEIHDAMVEGLKLCEKVRPDLLLGTDPDCDRCSAAFPDNRGGYTLISGNEMGIILFDYICKLRKMNNSMPSNPIAVTTIVSTDMINPIAEKYGVEIRRVLTGFKFIGEQIGFLDSAGEDNRFIFAFEESCGYLSGSYVRDKDAVNAVLLICEAVAFYKREGKTLLDVIDELYNEFGYYNNKLISFEFSGVIGMEKMSSFMRDLRLNPLREIAGFKVLSIIDYLSENSELPKSDVLQFNLAENIKFIVRPSGTEPKIKVYLSSVGKTMEEAVSKNNIIEEFMKKLMN